MLRRGSYKKLVWVRRAPAPPLQWWGRGRAPPLPFASASACGAPPTQPRGGLAPQRFEACLRLSLSQERCVIILALPPDPVPPTPRQEYNGANRRYEELVELVYNDEVVRPWGVAGRLRRHPNLRGSDPSVLPAVFGVVTTILTTQRREVGHGCAESRRHHPLPPPQARSVMQGSARPQKKEIPELKPKYVWVRIFPNALCAWPRSAAPTGPRRPRTNSVACFLRLLDWDAPRAPQNFPPRFPVYVVSSYARSAPPYSELRSMMQEGTKLVHSKKLEADLDPRGLVRAEPQSHFHAPFSKLCRVAAAPPAVAAAPPPLPPRFSPTLALPHLPHQTKRVDFSGRLGPELEALTTIRRTLDLKVRALVGPAGWR